MRARLYYSFETDFYKQERYLVIELYEMEDQGDSFVSSLSIPLKELKEELDAIT